MSRTACMWSILFYSEPHLLIGTLLAGNRSGGGTQDGDGVGNHHRLGIPEGAGCISPTEVLSQDMKAKFSVYTYTEVEFCPRTGKNSLITRAIHQRLISWLLDIQGGQK